MEQDLTPADVQRSLAAAGLDTQIIIYEASTRTAQDAADAIGTSLGSIVKSICLLIDGKPVLVLSSGDRIVDARKLADRFGVGRKKVRLADADSTRAITGYAPGGVPPLGHRQFVPILIDQDLMRFETVYAAGGSANAIFAIRLEDLQRVAGGEIVDVTSEPRSEAASDQEA